jgi:hypothetical protein
VILPVGKNTLTRRADTLVNPIFDYPPRMLLGTGAAADSSKKARRVNFLIHILGNAVEEGLTTAADWFLPLSIPTPTAAFRAGGTRPWLDCGWRCPEAVAPGRREGYRDDRRRALALAQRRVRALSFFSIGRSVGGRPRVVHRNRRCQSVTRTLMTANAGGQDRGCAFGIEKPCSNSCRINPVDNVCPGSSARWSSPTSGVSGGASRRNVSDHTLVSTTRLNRVSARICFRNRNSSRALRTGRPTASAPVVR